jgi:hypothetical protein
MRVSRQDATPASPRRSWAGTSGVSRPLEVAGWSPNHRASLFGAAFDNGKAGRPRKSAESRRVDVGSRSGGAAGSGSHHPARAAAWPQTTIGSRGVARTRRRPRRADRGYRPPAPHGPETSAGRQSSRSDRKGLYSRAARQRLGTALVRPREIAEELRRRHPFQTLATSTRAPARPAPAVNPANHRIRAGLRRLLQTLQTGRSIVSI